MSVDGGRVAHLIQSGIDDQRGWLDPLAERLQQGLSAAIEQGGPGARRVKDFLNGTWLGHPLHPVLTDAAIGGWLSGAVLDLAGAQRGADAAIGLGVLTALPTAAAGLADWHDQSGAPRRVGVVHAMLNSAALGCFVGSLIARGSGNRPLGVGLSTTGLALAMGGAYLGGELVYALGTQIDRNAWEPEAKGWQSAAKAADLVDGELASGEIEVEGTKMPLVLLKRGARVMALGGRCAHMGGPLSEGKLIEGERVECPWHGSTFDFQDGSVVQGPSAYPQPCFEARQHNGNIEVRQKH